MIGEQHSAQLGQSLRRILERPEGDRPLVESEREQLHLVGDGALGPVGQLVGAGGSDDVAEFRGTDG